MMSLSTPRAKQDSWLSLVAETAGVADCSIARVEFSSALGRRGVGDRRVIIQVVSAGGAVLGATTWFGSARELAQGVAVDLGYFGHGGAMQVMAWIDPSDVGADPFFSAATPTATTAPLAGNRATRVVIADDMSAAA